MLEPTSVKHQLLNSNSSEQTTIFSDMSIMATRATTRRARPLKDPVPPLETPQNTFSNLNEKKNKGFRKMQSSSPVIQLQTQFVEEDSEDLGDISRNHPNLLNLLPQIGSEAVLLDWKIALRKPLFFF